MAYRLYAHSVCDTTTPLQLQSSLVALYTFYLFTAVYKTVSNLSDTLLKFYPLLNSRSVLEDGSLSVLKIMAANTSQGT